MLPLLKWIKVKIHVADDSGQTADLEWKEAADCCADAECARWDQRWYLSGLTMDDQVEEVDLFAPKIAATKLKQLGLAAAAAAEPE